MKTKTKQEWARRWRAAKARVRSELHDLLVDAEVGAAALGVLLGRCLAELRRRFEDEEPKEGGHA